MKLVILFIIKNRERSQEKDDIIISQKLTNLNQYVINNHKQKKSDKINR